MIASPKMSNAPASPLYYEDLEVGRLFRTGSIEVTAEEITTFAARYDPQPFHLDVTAGTEHRVFGGLVASGWLTAGLAMRLMILSDFKLGGGAVGLGIDSLRWPRPVRPGDRLSSVIEIKGKRLSESKPGYGIMRIDTTTTNQNGEVVLTKSAHVLVPLRPL